MKKVFLLTVLAGASGMALAQTSVQLYGAADAGVGRVSARAPDILGNGTHGVGMMANDAMNNANSNVGLRGTEDLGGGLKAGFVFETDVNLHNGGAASNFWARQAHAWVGGNWGTVKLGRAFTPSRDGIAVWELADTANYSVVANTYGYDNAIGGYANRQNSQFIYKTPTFSGITGELGYVTKTDNGHQKWDGAVTYANGPVAAGLSINKTKDFKTNYSLGGKYDFGQFLVATSFNSVNDLNNQPRRGFSLGGTAKFGPAALTLDLTRDIKDRWLVANSKKYTNALLEGKYNLSKQTFLYAAYLRFDKTNNYGLGIHHAF